MGEDMALAGGPVTGSGSFQKTWLKQQTVTVSQSCRQEVKSEGVGRAAPVATGGPGLCPLLRLWASSLSPALSLSMCLSPIPRSRSDTIVRDEGPA